jgi:FixJ family two-component response regulator
MTASTSKSPTVVLVEDDMALVSSLTRQFERTELVIVATTASADAVIPTVQQHRPSVVLMDIDIQGNVDGITLAEELLVCEDTPVVFLSGAMEEGIVRRAAKSGAYAYLAKPTSMVAVVATLEMAIAKHAEVHDRDHDAALLSRTLDTLTSAIVVLGREGDIAFMNRAATELTGSRLAEAKRRAPAWTEQIARLQMDAAGTEVLLQSKSSEPVRCWAKRMSMPREGSVCVLEPIWKRTD